MNAAFRQAKNLIDAAISGADVGAESTWQERFKLTAP